MRFLAYDLSLDIIRGMQPALVAMRRRSSNLARHCSESLEGITLNLSEASGRYGGHRREYFATALSCLREVGAAIDIALACGALDTAPMAVERDRLGGMLWRLSGR